MNEKELAREIIGNVNNYVEENGQLSISAFGPLSNRIAAALTAARKEVEAEYALCRQIQKRGEHSSITCACVVAVEESIRKEEREAALRYTPQELNDLTETLEMAADELETEGLGDGESCQSLRRWAKRLRGVN